MSDQHDIRGRTALQLAYNRAGESYEAITEFRGKLLTLLPLATGTGVFLLLERAQADGSLFRRFLGPIGLFSAVVTVGLFTYELRGMQRCHRLEIQAAGLERQLGLSAEQGPFRGQPPRALGNMLGPPAAGLIIYLATAFVWLWLAGYGFSWRREFVWWTRVSDARPFLLGFGVVLVGTWILLSWWLRRSATGGLTKRGANTMIDLFDSQSLQDSSVVLAPDGSAVRPLCQISATGSFAHFQLQPGEVAKAVSHATVQEIWYVVAGAGEIWRRQDGQENKLVLRPGICLTIPLGTAFQFRAAGGSQPLKIVAATMPPWPVGSSDEARPEKGPWLPQLRWVTSPGAKPAT